VPARRLLEAGLRLLKRSDLQRIGQGRPRARDHKLIAQLGCISEPQQSDGIDDLDHRVLRLATVPTRLNHFRWIQAIRLASADNGGILR